MDKIEDLIENRVFFYFDQITKIPRCSGNEQKISDFLVEFAIEHGLKYNRDEHLNVVIYKDASSGKVDSPSIILQAHMDMVCEKTEKSEFNFDTDAIKYTIENGCLISKETTLGADNGIAVAMILAILESDEIEHPMIEALFTTNEEKGMTGASNLNSELFSSKRLLNIDSEEEGIAVNSCAGSRRVMLSILKKQKDISKNKLFYNLSVTGLKGGHSGVEIYKGLGNANKILTRGLNRLNEKFDIDLIEINGGNLENAIPRSSSAAIAINEEDLQEIQNTIVKINSDLVREFALVDPDLRFNFEKTISYRSALSDDVKNALIDMLLLLPNGVYSSDGFDEVISSANLAIVEDMESSICITTSIRSSLNSKTEEISLIHEKLAKILGFEYKIISFYPPWEKKINSNLAEITNKIYKRLYGKELKISSIHAGLECAIFTQSIGDIDMLSIGPNLYGVHAPGESVEIDSVNRVYEFITELLKNL